MTARQLTMVLAGVLLAAAPGAARAQWSPPGSALPVGTRVRLLTRSGVVWSGVVRAGPQPGSLAVALSGAADSAVVVPLDDVARAERAASESERFRVRRIALGAGLLSGLVGGALIGAMIPVERPRCGEAEFICVDLSGLDKAGHVAGGLLLGGLAGAGVGLMVGHSRAANAWRPVALPVRVAVASVGGSRIVVAVSATPP